jgi:cysteine synthase
MIDAFIGNTPILKLERVTKPDMGEVWVKLEVAASKTARH